MLSRDEFRRLVFKRDGSTCIVPGCGKAAVDAHHIIERKLWARDENEGYFADNGVSVCERHHKLAEVIIPPQMLRKWALISNRVMPKALNAGKDYDKWGVELKMPTREYIKFPSTPYLPFSEQVGEFVTDSMLLLNMPLLVTEKMDGSNVVLTSGKIAARNGTHADHPSFDLLKAEHASRKQRIPLGVQVFGEWLYAKHSIHYTGDLALDSFMQIFHAYDVRTRCFLGWDDVKALAEQVGYPVVPALAENVEYSNIWEFQAHITKMAQRVIKEGREGIVVRPMTPFHYSHFEQYTGKYVRANHVQTDEHWRERTIVRNEKRISNQAAK